MSLTLRVLAGELTIVRLAPDTPFPAWLPLSAAPLTSLTVTEKELSIVCPSSAVPANLNAQPGWIALRVEETLDFSAVGILSSILKPLAASEINILSISTFDTDYILVPVSKLSRALEALRPHFALIETDI